MDCMGMVGSFYKIKLFVMVLALLSIGSLFAVPVYGDGVIDQSSIGQFEGECALAPALGREAWQSFTPTQDNLLAVDLFMLRGEGISPDDVTVTIFLGTFSLPLLELGSQTVSVPVAAGETRAFPKIIHFDFVSPIPLVPGDTYSIKVVGSGDSLVLCTGLDLYVGGSFTYLINFIPIIEEDGDMGFRTYSGLTPPNTPPTAADNSATVAEGGSVNINLAANDSDADDGLNLASIVVTPATNGAVVVNLDGTVDYTHDGSETVSDSFTYTIDDNSAATSNSATVSITVTPVNDPPTAFDSAADIIENTDTIINLQVSDPDGGPLTFDKVLSPSHATAFQILNLGSVTYFSSPTFPGTDSFSFIANDGIADSNEATVTIESVGTLISPGDQLITVLDLPEPDGVSILTDPVGGATPAQLSPCNIPVILINIFPGSNFTLDCSSATLNIIAGSITIQVQDTGGNIAIIILNAGDFVTLNEDLTITNNQDTPATIEINGIPTTIGIGQTITINQSPDCSNAIPSSDSIWPPNHKFVNITISGVTDPDGDTVTITVDAIEQDEPVNGKGDGNTSPDGIIDGDGGQVRAERSGNGDGRIYEILFNADDGNGGTCNGSVTVGVPHDKKDTAVDSEVRFDSTS